MSGTRRSLSFLLVAAAALLVRAAPVSAADEPAETLLLEEPTISATHVAFVHAQDLWVVPRTGGEAVRLTSGVGSEGSPRFSPDGRTIAFTGTYEGNADVYTIPTAGGTPRRLTWHPAADRVQGWTPDGARILFTSPREGGKPVDRAYLVAAVGGVPEALPLPSVGRAAVDADGRVAYTPWPEATRTWKRYRGGRTTPIWVFDPKTNDVATIPHVNATDTSPAWLGGTVWFASDRGGTMNLYRFAPGAEAVEAVTSFTDFDVRGVSTGAGAVVFSQGGAIHVLDPKSGDDTRLRITVRSDGLGRLPRWVPGKDHVRAGAPSPEGQRAVLEVRGEILTLPRENGDPRNLSNSPGANDRDPVWSPDGKKVAWFSDESGEYRLVVRDHLGREAVATFDLKGAGFYHDPVFSPDGKHVLYSDRGNRVAFVTLETGAVTTVADNQGSLGTTQPAASWSPDSAWIAFEHRDAITAYDHVDLFEVATGKVIPLTDAFGDAGSPAFSRDGKYLFFRASSDSGARRFGLDMSASLVRKASSSLYAVVLAKAGKSPLAPRSDEGDRSPKAGERPAPGKDGPGKDGPGDGDKPAPDGGKDDKEDKDGKDGKDDKPAAEPKDGDKPKVAKPAPKTVLDLEGLDQRIVALPLPSGSYGALAAVKEGLLYTERGEDGPSVLKLFDLEERKSKDVLKAVDAFTVSASGKQLLAKAGGAWMLTTSLGKDEKRLDLDRVRVRVEPELEWRQILREVWRIQRDYFYDPKMHGVDWNAMWARWSPFLAHVHHRADLNLVISDLIGELAAGHEYVGGGDLPAGPTAPGTGLLGADFAVEGGRFRLARIHRGQNWNPGLRAPLTEPGVDAKVGDYLIAVDGVDVKADRELFAAFEATADRQVELTWSDAPEGGKLRRTTVVPVASDGELRRRAWIESNRANVDRLSGGRLAYVYMPDTGGGGLAAFDRDFYSQLDKQGLVLDERYNGGGKIADYVIGVLGRKVLCHWRTRDGWLARTPFGTLEGPKVMLINERAGSGGDALPWMFRKTGLGPLVGVRTWGGLVGISGYPVLMDGGSVTSAAFGIVDTDGTWVVENEGVAPDLEVFETPKDLLAGRDPQLEAGVRLALEALEKSPPRKAPVVGSPTPR